MELKRYVMMNKEIYEVERVLENDVKYVYFKAVGKEYNRTIYDGDVYKTSDNILDLVEVGDLVGEKITSNTQLDCEGFKGDDVRQVITLNDRLKPPMMNAIRFYYNGGAVQDEYIVAIYKLQPNGDYKRYEVK